MSPIGSQCQDGLTETYAGILYYKVKWSMTMNLLELKVNN